MPGPLEGIRVLDLADGTAGPYAAMLLGDAGADVIKIERLGGDRTRNWGSKSKGDYGVAFLHLNRNKRGVALDVDTEAGAAVVRRVIDRSDVMITDAGWTEHADLQPDVVVEQHSRILYCLFSQYGDRGPWAGRPPYGELPAQLVTDATSGLGRPNEPPLRVATDMSSMYAGINAVQAICAGLYARDTAGGQRIDVSLLGSLMTMRPQVWVSLSDPENWWGFQLDWFMKPPDVGNLCKDGPILFTIPTMTQEQRDRLYADLDMEWVRDDPQYEIMNEDRAGIHGRYQWLTRPLWNRALAKFTVAEVVEIAERNGCEAFPWNTYEDMIDHPQFKHLEIMETVEHSDLGGVQEVTSPWKFSDTPVAALRAAPRLGEHTEEVLTEVGYSGNDIAGLHRSGVAALG